MNSILLVAIAEGFSTLAVEVIAIRLAIPVTGASMTLTGVMLAVVLLALSAGYWRGGQLSGRWERGRIPRALARNLLAASVLYCAVAFPFEAMLLEWLLARNLPLAAAIGLAAAVLYAPPVYLASQTVPMLAEAINASGKAGEASGRVLFFSTVGSVAGGVVTPVWLFPWIGVRGASWVVFLLLAGCAAGMVFRLGILRLAVPGILAAGLVVLAGRLAGSDDALFSYESAHQSFRVVEDEDEAGRALRVLSMSGGRSSSVYADSGETASDYILDADAALAACRPQRVLVLGAAGFTLPRDAARLDFVRTIDAVDVDPEVREIAERHFLKSPLSQKIRFIARSGRLAVRECQRAGVRFDFTFLDAYFGRGVPEELMTVEFFAAQKAISTRTLANFIFDRSLASAFARNSLATMRAAFGGVWVKQVSPEDQSRTSNFLVADFPVEGSVRWSGGGVVYRDDLNTADRDRVELMWPASGGSR